MKSPRILLACLFAAAASTSFAITVPYTNNFSSDPLGTDFSGGGQYGGSDSGSVTYNSSAQALDLTNAATNYGQVDYTYATAAASNLNVGTNGLNDFYMSSTMKATINYDAGGTGTVGLGLSSGGFGRYTGNNFYYGALWIDDSLGGGRVGNLVINQSDGADGIDISAGSVNFPGYTNGTTYTLSFNGTYSGSTLNLSFSVTDGVTTRTQTASVSSQPFANLTNFGPIQVDTNFVGITTQMDNFSLSNAPVPEPSQLGMVLMGLVGLCVVRRFTGRRTL